MIARGPGRAFGQQGVQVVSSLFINNSSLSGTLAIADNDIWAVGSIGNTASNVVTLAEHFNWSNRSVVSTPLVKGSLFASVAAAASNDVWAVGLQNDGSNGNAKPLMQHWNGTSWSVVSSPQFAGGSFLDRVAADSANEVWAVGQGNAEGLVEHWNGTSWSIVASPQPNIILRGIAASPPTRPSTGTAQAGAFSPPRAG